MARGANQKFKFPYLMKIMQEKTDDQHGITMSQIMEELQKYDVTAERKSIYADLTDMTEHFGIEILKEQHGKETYYHVGNRPFELAEVKLLIDAIQSSKFITQKKSEDLIKKVKGLVSEYQAKQLQRQVIMGDRVKSMNESVYYNVDDIHKAINENRQITFHYYRWNLEKELEPTHGGALITVSPWALTWSDENYYLIAYDASAQKIKHYRVDKMKQITLTLEKREGRENFKSQDLAQYSKATFGMFHGEPAIVHIQFADSMCGVFIDHFGRDIPIHRVGEGHSETRVHVYVSQQFYGWIFGLGPEVRVTGPDWVVANMHDYVASLLENYQ